MTNDYNELKKYSSAELLKAVVTRLFEKKAVREVICGAAVLLSLVCMDKVKQVQSVFWWLYGLCNLPFYTMFAAGIAGLVASFVRFGKRGFAVTAVAAGVLLWVYKSFVVCFGALFPGTETAVLVEWIVMELLYTAPTLIVSLAIILLPIILHAKRSSLT